MSDDILDKVNDMIGNKKLSETYEELKKSYDSGLIRPADDCVVVQGDSKSETTMLDNIINFIRGKIK